VVETLTPSE
jgi:DNA processing protein